MRVISVLLFYPQNLVVYGLSIKFNFNTDAFLTNFLPMQFYTFLEKAMVTSSLLPSFIAFFSDGEIPGTPWTLATTFLSFGDG